MINLLTGIDSTSSALDAERIRMDVISGNIANANVTRDVNGKPYQRKEVVFESILKAQQGLSAPGGSNMVHIARVQADTTPFQQVYNPGHPDANAQGMVSMPNVNIHQEMVDMIASSRTYEANLAVVKNARTMAMQALAIAKHA